jgi:hypothetical protein
VRIEDGSVGPAGETLEGVTDGLDARGFLQLRVGQSVGTVLSGTVRPV